MLALLASLSLPAVAQEEGVDYDEEIVVYGDLFARWDGTRWAMATELVVPHPIWLMADRNRSVRVKALQIHSVLACEKDWKLTRRRWQVHCTMEDMGIQAVPVAEDRKYEHTQAILDEIDAKLTGASLQLQAKDNGRVVNVQLEGVEADNRRERNSAETLRMILSRLIAGWDMKLRRGNFLGEGQWVEYDNQLLAMPSHMRSLAGGIVVHQLHKYKGHRVVQTVGEGHLLDDLNYSYKVDLQGVSVYDYDEGYMTERVWYVYGERTAAGFYAAGTASLDYWHAGRLLMLEPDQEFDVGPTRALAPPGWAYDGWNMPQWRNIEQQWTDGFDASEAKPQPKQKSESDNTGLLDGIRAGQPE